MEFEYIGTNSNAIEESETIVIKEYFSHTNELLKERRALMLEQTAREAQKKSSLTHQYNKPVLSQRVYED